MPAPIPRQRLRRTGKHGRKSTADRGSASAKDRIVAVAYLRVSTEDQAREGYSLDFQREHIRAQCAAKGYDLVKEFVDDGFSGRTTNRPAFQELMKAIREGFEIEGRVVRVQVVVVARFDRLNRNLYDFLATQREMQRCKAEFASVHETVDTSGPFGRFFVQMIAAFAELESGLIGVRVRDGMRQKALQGGFNGMSAPFGFDVRKGGLRVNEKEAAVVRTIVAWRQEGRTLRRIADDLNSEGVPTKKGKKWTERQIFRIVHCPLYRGSLHWAGIETPGAHPAIVSWNQPPKRRRRRRRRTK